MGNRLSKIYTRTGDDGTTGLGDGRRIAKDDARVEAYGTVDELNSAIGMILSVTELPHASRRRSPKCSTIFSISAASCAFPERAPSRPRRSRDSRKTLDGFNDDLPPLKEFILPGGGPAAAACHLARTIARRAERRAWSLAKSEP
jgi:cob(I)alamin adenosyltransferase